MGLSPISLCGCGQEVGHCESLILYHKDLYIFVKVSQVTIFYSSLDTFINTNTTPKGGAPAQAEYTSKKERKKERKVINSDNGASDFIWAISMAAELKVPGIPGTSYSDFTRLRV